ncbi:hypothetical protein BH11PSE7_BH11PSE7_30280 [soil metagenome]
MSARNDLNTATCHREGKAYASLAAQFAMIGMELIKSDPEICGQAPYYAMRSELWKPLKDLDAARTYLDLLTDRAGGDGQELQAQ